MTQGYLLFAHNNEQIPYGLFAVWQAHRIAKWLNKPVSIVTDHKTLDSLKGLESVFDHIIISNNLIIHLQVDPVSCILFQIEASSFICFRKPVMRIKFCNSCLRN